MHRHTIGWAAAFALVLYASMPSARADSDPALVQAAEKEGSLVVYACDPGETPRYLKAFGEKYPKIKVTSYLAGCWQDYNRHVNEHSAKKTVGSVFMATDDVMGKLQGDKLLDRYVSPELKHFPATAQPDSSDYTIVKLQLVGMAVNRDFVGDMKMPEDWNDFVSPRPEWKGKVTYYDPRTSSGALSVLSALYQNFGAEKTAAIYKGLKASDAELAATTSAGLAKLLTGERPIMFYLISNHFGTAIDKGAPLTFSIPKSGGIGLSVGIAPLKDGPSPNAARLFVDFMLNEMQAEIRKHGEYALREGLAPPEKLPVLDTVKTMPFDSVKAIEEQSKVLDLWKSAVGVE
jgi:iron(III) transport system substrate-binding protein